MNLLMVNRLVGVVGAVAMVSLGGCTDPEPTPPCPQVGGVCVGVPAGEVGGGGACAEGVTCAQVIAIKSDADLQDKAMTATAGACLSLAPGQYTAVSLPGGVSLLGCSAESVNVDAIVLGAGSGAVVRGIAVGSQGIELQGATSVRIESVRVTGDPDVLRDGIALGVGSSATIVTSTIDGAGRVGVFAEDADVTIDRCLVSGAHAAGVWVEGPNSASGMACDTSCACPQRPKLTTKGSLIRGNHLIGISASGATVSLEDVDVIDSLSGDTLQSSKDGGGVAITSCSTVTAIRLRVLGSAAYGVLIDGSTGTLGDDKTPDDTVEISGNKRGLWIQNVKENSACLNMAACLTLHNGTFTGNSGVGIGVAGSSRGVILCKSVVEGTVNKTLPVYEGGVSAGLKDVGDGLNWLENSDVTIEALTLRDNARQSLLIDGPATGRIMSLSLEGSDANKMSLQQNWMMGQDTPTTGSGVTLVGQGSITFAVPGALAVPVLLAPM